MFNHGQQHYLRLPGIHIRILKPPVVPIRALPRCSRQLSNDTPRYDILLILLYSRLVTLHIIQYGTLAKIVCVFIVNRGVSFGVINCRPRRLNDQCVMLSVEIKIGNTLVVCGY